MKRKILLAAGVGFFVALAGLAVNTLTWRWKVEHRNKTVEICLDSLETAVICNNENYPLTQFLSEARSNGVSSLAIYEEAQDGTTSNSSFSYLPKNAELINITKGGYFSGELLNLAKTADLKPLYRPLNRAYESPEYVFQKLGAGIESEASIIAAGEESLGYQDKKEWYIPLINKKNLFLPVPEFTKQLGLIELARLVPEQVIRAHTVDIQEASRIPYNILTQRYLRAVRERGCRLLYIHMLPSQGIKGNLEMLKELSTRLIQNGFILGKTTPPFSDFNNFSSPSRRVILWFRSLAALLIAIAIPVMALRTGLRLASNGTKIILAFLTITSVTLTGALMIGSLLSNREFMLGLETIHGIKAAMILPVIGTVFLVFSRDTLRRFLAKPMTNIEFLGLCAILAFLAVLLIRSGNYNLFTPEFEINLRDFLDRFLGVRPRFKEFLIGHPVLLTGLYLYTKQKKGQIAIIIGSIGQISIINTFLHSHVPLSISFLRTFHGLWIGIIMGALSIKTLSILEKRTRPV